MKQKKEKKALDRFFKVLYTLFFIAAGFIVLLLILSKFSIPGVPQVFVVQSGSMEPSISTGSVVVVRKAESYAEGDVITFARNNNATPVTHRIVEITESGNRTQFMTRGDANEDEDSTPVFASRVIGKVLFDIPYVGYGVAAARQPYGFLIIIVLPALIIMYDEIVKIIKEVKRLKRQKIDSE